MDRIDRIFMIKNGKILSILSFFSRRESKTVMIKSQRWMLLFILCASVTACRAADSSVTGAVVPFTTGPAGIETAAPFNDITNSRNGLTPSFSPSSTPWPDLHTAGPYLFLSPRFSSDPITPIFYELDGSGKRDIRIPETAFGSLSPDKRNLAFLSFEEDEYGSPNLDKGIELLTQDVWSGTTAKVADLLPADYYARQERMVERFVQEAKFLPEYETYTTFDLINVDAAIDTIRTGFWILSWSPDGRHLAFPAMIDGDSSDVYVYDIDTGVLQRKETEYLNVSEIQWSPDGRWILYRNAFPMNSSRKLQTELWSVPIDSMKKVTIANACDIKWITETEFLFVHCSAGDGGNEWQVLSLGNIQNGAVTEIWRGILYPAYAVDWKNETVLLVSEEPCDSDECEQILPGLYLGPLAGTKRRIGDIPSDITGYSTHVAFRGGDKHRFVFFTSESVFGIAQDGGSDLLFSGKGVWNLHISPNKRWFIITGELGVVLFDQYDNRVFEWTNDEVFDAAWKTNSQGVYFLTNNEIFYLSVQSPFSEIPIGCPLEDCGINSRIALLPSIHLFSLPSLRARPPSIENPTQGTSLWTRAAFQDLPEPGIREYSFTIPAYSEWRWDFSWCADTQAGLEAILAPVDLRFYIGGELLGEDIFRIYETAKAGAYCRKWATLLSGWQPGDETDLTIRYTLREAVNDGTSEYPPGEYRQIMHVTV
jgi:hypothetical protein